MRKISLLLMILFTTIICYAQNGSFIAHSGRNSITSYNGENILPSMYNDGRAITEGQWYYYDNGVNEDAIGTGGGQFWWGIMFPAGTYSGNAVAKVSAYDYMAMSGIVTVYNDGSNSPSNAVGSMNVTFTGSGEFVEFSFSNPVMINPNNNVWIVFYNASGATFPAAVCVNTGNANGRWVSTDGTTWEDLASYGLDYTFMVRAFFEQYSNLFVDFDDSQIPTGWTIIDGGIPTGYGWHLASSTMGTGYGHNGSSDCMISQSYDNGYGVIYPDNYLISPHVTVANGSVFSFYACAQDASYAAEHFGVAVSTTGANASDFTMVQEWTMVAKGSRYNGPRGNRQGNWYYCGVDLSAYAGQPIYVAIRHFNCSDMFYLDVDDILLTNYTQIFDFNVNATASPSYGGTVSGGGIYNQGNTCTLHANANNGYSFFSWTENGVLISTNPTYSFYVTENRNLVANFVPAGGNKCTLIFDLYDSYGDGWNNSILNVAFNNGLPTQHLTMFSGSFVSYGLEIDDGTGVTLSWSSGNWVYECSFIIHYADGTIIYQGSDLNNNFSYNFQMDCPGSTTNYTISVSANPSNGGTVTGGGIYSQGQSCTVSATNNSGFTFTNWTENGSVVSTQSSYTFTVNNNRILVANFQTQPQSYVINVSANPTNGGTVTGGGTYQQGQSCTVTAAHNPGYTFTNWTENGNVVSTDASYTFTVTGNRTLVANFTQEQYTITVSADPTNGGTVTGGGIYTYGQFCEITATPNTPNFNFINWTENGNPVSNQLSYTFTVTSDRNLVANFTTQNYIISAIAYPTDGGNISGAGGYDYGQTCYLEATPATGYEFVNWIKDGTPVSTNTSYSFTVTESALYEAHFRLQSFTINASANPEDGGSVTGGGTYYYGQTCYLEATPVSDYTFINWTKEGEFVSNQLSYSFAVTESASYEANFDKIIFEITATADPINGGDVSGAGTYSYGDTCTLTATARTGFVFENWTRNSIVVSTSSNYPFQVSRNADYVAHFTMDANHCIITALADPSEGGMVSGDGTFELGDTCTLSATPVVGYEFVNWTLELDGSQVSTNASFSFSVTGNAVYVAHFVRNYTITANVEPIGAGSIVGTGTFKEGESCTLIASPNPTYSFEKWTENGMEVLIENPYSFTVDRDRDLVAVFSQGLYYTIKASAGANGTISPEGDVFVEPGEDKTFTIIPNSGCQVSKVLVDGIDHGPIPSYTFRSVNEDHTIHVEFSGLGVDDTYDLGLTIYPNPANDYIIVEGTDMNEITLYDLLGIQQLHEEVNDNHVKITTNNLIAGTYILKVFCKDGRSGHLRFVVAR